jgi:hypothetical protein
MSFLKPGTRCVIVSGCPENIGLIVEVIAHIGSFPPYADAYRIRAVSSRPFPQYWNSEGNLISGSSDRAITDRHKLRPLVDPKEESRVDETEIENVRSRKRELAKPSS